MTMPSVAQASSASARPRIMDRSVALRDLQLTDRLSYEENRNIFFAVDHNEVVTDSRVNQTVGGHFPST
jgi:hypothetical protein